MKTKIIIITLILLGYIGVCVLYPPLVLVAVVAAVLLIPLLLLTTVENIPFSIGLRMPYRSTFSIVCFANGASMLAGFIPVAILNSALYSAYMPQPLAAYFRAYPLASALGSLIFFVAALLVEFGVIALWFKALKTPVGWKKLMLVVLVMNAMTHSVLAPLNYWVKRPRHDVKVFTDDSSWAQHPLTEIYYTAPDGTLCAIMTDGSNPRVVSPDTVREYQYLDEYHYEWSGEDLKMYANRDKNEHISITAKMYFGSYIKIEQGNDKWRIADDPGLMLFFSNRTFEDICILENGQEFVFSESKGGIYLVNIAERKVGQITSGKRLMTLTPRYKRDL